MSIYKLSIKQIFWNSMEVDILNITKSNIIYVLLIIDSALQIIYQVYILKFRIYWSSHHYLCFVEYQLSSNIPLVTITILGMVSEYIRRSHYNESVSVLSHNYQPGLRDRYRQQHRQQAEHQEVRYKKCID